VPFFVSLIYALAHDIVPLPAVIVDVVIPPEVALVCVIFAKVPTTVLG
jgi:hypothetical protein